MIRVPSTAPLTSAPTGIDRLRPKPPMNDPSSLRSPQPIPIPAAAPAADATAPMAADSATTLTATCRPEAPMARSRAISRVRWATVIVKVL